MSYKGTVGQLEVDSPWANAGGVVKTVEDVEFMAGTGVGWIEAGSYTLEPRVGNSPNGETVYYHDSHTGETFNSLGMPNKGLDVVETEIPQMVEIAHAHGKPLVVNVAPVSGDPVSEVQELVSRTYSAGADGVIVNAGCPNVITDDGGRHEILSYKADELRATLSGLTKVTHQYGPVWVRLSPFLPGKGHNMLRASQALWAPKGVVSAVLSPNTWGGQKPLKEDGTPILEVDGNVGGKSGPAVASEALEQARTLVHLLRGTNIDVVLSSGITNAEALSRGLGVGAVAGAGTTFYYETKNGWQEDTDRLLSDLADN